MAASDVTSWLPNLLGPVDLEVNGAAVSVPKRLTVNLVGNGIAIEDSPENNRTDIRFPFNTVPYADVSADTTITSAQEDVYVTTANVTVTLPASPSKGERHRIFAIGVTNVVVSGNGKSINNATSIALDTNDCLSIEYTGSKWSIVRPAMYNVRDFGARGDGVTDDTAAIQTAITSAVGTHTNYRRGGVVYFPPGVYVCTSPLNAQASHYLTLRGDGGYGPGFGGWGDSDPTHNNRAPSTILYTGSGSTAFLQLNSALGAHLVDLGITYNSATFTGILIDFSKTVYDSSYCIVERCYLGSDVLGSWAAASLIDLNRAEMPVIRDCHLTGAKVGVRFRKTRSDFSSCAVVERCFFRDFQTAATVNPGMSTRLLWNVFEYDSRQGTSTGSFTYVAATHSITRASGSFLTDGFSVGDSVTTTGTVSNNFTKTITALTATQMTFASGVTDESAVTSTVTKVGTIFPALTFDIADVDATPDNWCSNLVFVGNWMGDGTDADVYRLDLNPSGTNITTYGLVCQWNCSPSGGAFRFGDLTGADISYNRMRGQRLPGGGGVMQFKSGGNYGGVRYVGNVYVGGFANVVDNLPASAFAWGNTCSAAPTTHVGDQLPINGALSATTGTFSSTVTCAGLTGVSGNLSFATGASRSITAATAAATQAGVAITVQAGAGGVASTSAAGAGGASALTGGIGGASDGTGNAGAGGAANTTGGVGGAGSGTIPGGAGGAVVHRGGQGGAGGGSSASGAGGAIQVLGGNAGTAGGSGQGNGGNAFLDGGTGATNGTVFIGTSNAPTVSIGKVGMALFLTSLLQSGLPSKVGSVASATTIAPTSTITHVTGTTAISTITPPTAFAQSGGGGVLWLIADGLWTIGTGGNVAVGITAAVGKAYGLLYDNATSKWYPLG